MIDTQTRILGLLGYPLEHSYSPLLHNHSLRELKLNYVYLPLEVEPDSLEEAFSGLKALGFRGVNVTIPYKEKVIPMLDELDPLADKIGAVNTIVYQEGCCRGYNTDASGFLEMLNREGNFDPTGNRAVVLGAGGAARAVCFALASKGIDSLTLINRTRSRALELEAELIEAYPDLDIIADELARGLLKSSLDRADLLVDTTPVGMAPNTDVEPLVGPELLHPELLVVDLVYNPRETVLLKAARSAGAETLDGSGMLLYQGIEAFELWTGHRVDPDSWYQLFDKKRKDKNHGNN